jgi:hypothetical protein
MVLRKILKTEVTILQLNYQETKWLFKFLKFIFENKSFSYEKINFFKNMALAVIITTNYTDIRKSKIFQN